MKRNHYAIKNGQLIWLFLVINIIVLPLNAWSWMDMKSSKDFRESNRKIRNVLLEANTFVSNQMGYWVEIKESDYLLFGDSLIINPDGTHFLYSYNFERKTFLRLDKSSFHGHNFGRRLFVYKGDIYAIGGNGFWISHCKLIRFNRTSREWDLVHITGPLPLPSPGTTLIFGDTMYLYGTREMGSMHLTRDPKLDYSVFFIDLRTWKSYQRNSPSAIRPTPHTQTFNDQRSRYSVFGNFGSIDRIFDKVTGILYFSFSGPSLYNGIDKKHYNYQDSIYSFLMGSDILIMDRKGNERIVSIPEYIKLYCNPEWNVREIKNYTFADENDSNIKINAWIYILLFTLLISWLVLGVYYYRNSKGMTQKLIKHYRELDNTNVDVAALLRLIDGDYSEKEIDLILQIEHLPKVVRNVKRSKLLFEINEQFPGIIEKITDNSLDNTFVYRVSKRH
jgi:hypothetical protein